MKPKLLVVAIGTYNVAAVRQELQNRREKYIMEPLSLNHPRRDEVKFFVDEPQHTRLTQELQALLGKAVSPKPPPEPESYYEAF